MQIKTRVSLCLGDSRKSTYTSTSSSLLTFSVLYMVQRMGHAHCHVSLKVIIYFQISFKPNLAPLSPLNIYTTLSLIGPGRTPGTRLLTVTDSFDSPLAADSIGLHTELSCSSNVTSDSSGSTLMRRGFMKH